MAKLESVRLKPLKSIVPPELTVTENARKSLVSAREAARADGAARSKNPMHNIAADNDVWYTDGGGD